MASRKAKIEVRDSSPKQAITNLRWLSRAIEDGVPIEKAIREVYSMEIYGFAGDLRALLKEVSK